MEDAAETEARVRRAAAGDRAAAEALLAGLLPRVRNLIRYLVRGDQDVDDMAQQALVAVLRGLPGYRADAPLERWADRITAREAMAYVRRRRTRDAREGAELALEVLPAPEETARYLARRELARRLDTLPDPQREAIVLHHLVALTVPEVAEALGVSPDTAKSRIRLGMEKLRAAAAQEGADAP